MTLKHNSTPRFVGEALDLLSEDTPAHELPIPLQKAIEDGFSIDGCIQNGSRFAVWRGVSRAGVEVILKHPAGNASGLERAAKQLKDEFEVLSSIKHDGIVKPIAFAPGVNGYLAMVFEGDRDLSEWIKSTRPGRETLAQMLTRTVSALSALHESGLVHGDLKPEHVVIRDDGSPAVIDFGLAERWRDIDRNIQLSHRIGGTNQYMAPEVAGKRVERPDPNQDVHACGVVFREAFETAGLKPGRFKPVIRKSTDPNPTQRYPDADALLSATRQAQAKRSRPIWIAAVLLVLLVASVTMLALNDRGTVEIKNTPDAQPLGDSPYGQAFPARLARLNPEAAVLAWVDPEGVLRARQVGSDDIHAVKVTSPIRNIDVSPQHIAVAHQDGSASVYTHGLEVVGSIRLDAPIRSICLDRNADNLYCWVQERSEVVTTRFDGTVNQSRSIEADYILWDTDHPGHAIAARRDGLTVIDLNSAAVFESKPPTTATITAADYDTKTSVLTIGTADGQVHRFDGKAWTSINLRTAVPITAVHASGYAGIAGEVLALDWKGQRIAGRYGTPISGLLEMQLIVNGETLTAVTPIGVGTWDIEHSH